VLEFSLGARAAAGAPPCSLSCALSAPAAVAQGATGQRPSGMAVALPRPLSRGVAAGGSIRLGILLQWRCGWWRPGSDLQAVGLAGSGPGWVWAGFFMLLHRLMLRQR
jgi:hypothetical protein